MLVCNIMTLIKVTGGGLRPPQFIVLIDSRVSAGRQYYADLLQSLLIFVRLRVQNIVNN